MFLQREVIQADMFSILEAALGVARRANSRWASSSGSSAMAHIARLSSFPTISLLALTSSFSAFSAIGPSSGSPALRCTRMVSRWSARPSLRATLAEPRARISSMLRSPCAKRKVTPLRCSSTPPLLVASHCSCCASTASGATPVNFAFTSRCAASRSRSELACESSAPLRPMVSSGRGIESHKLRSSSGLSSSAALAAQAIGRLDTSTRASLLARQVAARRGGRPHASRP
mmetsp:Transcript_12090/g.31038  ORF Transcript_12090/g.31038 Transcript_12090/m.31038 type:complete len:231 (-) Transcript_12090:262-954(-)